MTHWSVCHTNHICDMSHAYVWHESIQCVTRLIHMRDSFTCATWLMRPTQLIYVPLQVNRFQEKILLVVQYKYLKSCSGYSILQNLILCTRSCSTGFITQSSWVFHFHQTIMVGWKCFVPQLYQLRRGISEGPALKYFYMIHRVGLYFQQPCSSAGRKFAESRSRWNYYRTIDSFLQTRFRWNTL